jgi:MSHA biogenesis protein MshL
MLLVLAIAGCASTPAPPPTAVLDAIQREMGSAIQAPVQSKSALDQALLPPLQLDAPKPGEARFDIAVQNAPASQVFNAIVVGTPFSMLIPPDLTGNVTLNLKNVTLRDVLDTLRDLYGYDYRLQGDRIYPQSNAMQTKVFQVSYLMGRRQGSTNVNLTPTSITGTPATSGTAATPTTGATGATGTAGANNAGGARGGASVSTTSDSDFWRDLQTALTTLVGTADGRSVVMNGSSGLVLVRAMPAELREVEKYLKTTQLVIERQVMLEAKIIEVSLSDEYQSGVNWAAFRSRPNSQIAVGSQGASTMLGAAPAGTAGSLTAPNLTITPGAATGVIETGLAKGFYGLAFQSANFAALLGFLESQGNVHVLSSPRVATLNNQKAVLKVGNDEFFVTNVATTTTTGTGATTTSPTVTLQPFFSGIALDVTPQIDANDQIILHVHPSISTVSEKTKTIDLGAGGSLSLPLATSAINESDAIVRVRDGQIVAIGGLMRQRQSGDRSGLPGTIDSAAGALLGQRSRSLSKSELVILIKPTIIHADNDWLPSMNETNQRLQEYAPPAPVRISRP